MSGVRATNLESQKWIVRKHRFVPETEWINHCREGAGLVPQGTYTANSTNPCPPENKSAIV